jgi:surfeit locus 1 family protein
MTRRLPLVPTLVVAVAALVMIGLGIWQLQRADEKAALLARYEAARNLPPVAFPTMPVGEDLPLFRRASGHCVKVEGQRSQAGRNRAGEGGYVHIAECSTGAEGPGMAVELGWSKDPNAGRGWGGGPVSGIIAPDRAMRMRLVSAAGLAGLEPSAPPSPASIPNNHLFYAVQWFLFAGIALLIYWLALRKRQRAKGETSQP